MEGVVLSVHLMIKVKSGETIVRVVEREREQRKRIGKGRLKSIRVAVVW